jgi:hypothetical protein
MRLSKYRGFAPRRTVSGKRRGKMYKCKKGSRKMCRSVYSENGKYVIFGKSKGGACNNQLKSFKGPLIARCYTKGMKKRKASRKRPKHWGY